MEKLNLFKCLIPPLSIALAGVLQLAVADDNQQAPTLKIDSPKTETEVGLVSLVTVTVTGDFSGKSVYLCVKPLQAEDMFVQNPANPVRKDDGTGFRFRFVAYCGTKEEGPDGQIYQIFAFFDTPGKYQTMASKRLKYLPETVSLGDISNDIVVYRTK